jgi:hypothetical protein
MERSILATRRTVLDGEGVVEFSTIFSRLVGQWLRALYRSVIAIIVRLSDMSRGIDRAGHTLALAVVSGDVDQLVLSIYLALQSPDPVLSMVDDAHRTRAAAREEQGQGQSEGCDEAIHCRPLW